MEWHNENLLPSGLPELAYQVTPGEIADRLRVVALAGRRHLFFAWYEVQALKEVLS